LLCSGHRAHMWKQRGGNVPMFASP